MGIHSTLFSASAIRQILRDPERKSIPRMVWEIARCWQAKGERPGHYFKTLLYREGVAHPEGFVSQGEAARLWAHLRETYDDSEFSDKVRFQLAFQEVDGVRLPRYLGRTEPGSYVSPQGERLRLESQEDMKQALLRMLEGLTAGAAVFAKPAVGQKGRGAFRLRSPDEAGALWEAVQHAPYLFQKAVDQHAAMSAVMPDMLNTLRIMTLRRDDGRVVVASAYQKFGRRGAVADNASSMLIAGVDLETGRLHDHARTKFQAGGTRHTHHPDTGQRVSGFEVPMFQAALDMTVAAARRAEPPMLGWDVGIAADGPVIVEGNRAPGFKSGEMAHGAGYLVHPVLGPYLRRTLAMLRSR